MAFFGLFAIILNFVDRVPTLLMWIYNWGETPAWIIKIGLVVVGAILYFAGPKPAVEEPVAESEASAEASEE